MKKVFIFFSVLLATVLIAPAVNAQTSTLFGDLESQNQAFAGKSGAGLSSADPRLIVGQIIKILLAVTGTVFVCWTTYGGYLIFTSAGESEKIDHAKSIITNGVIGIIVVLASYSITVFIYRMWVKTGEDPGAPQSNFWVTPDTDYYNTDPLQENTALPIKLPEE